MTLISPPGGGKGTISKYLMRDFGFHHISTGNLLRRHVQEKSVIGKRIEDILRRGELVDDDTVAEVVHEERIKCGKQLLLFDGYPRNLHQAQSLDEIDIAIQLQVPSKIIVQRLSQRWIHSPSGRVYSDFSPPKVEGKDDITGEPLTQRDDDKPETIQTRLDQYYDNIQPLIDYYHKNNVLASFAGVSSKHIYSNIVPFLSHKHQLLPQQEAADGPNQEVGNQRA